MANWYDMELPEGYAMSGGAHASARGDGVSFVDIWRVENNTTVCLLYSDAHIHISGLGAAPISFPTLQDAKKYIIMRCALNNWGEEE